MLDQNVGGAVSSVSPQNTQSDPLEGATPVTMPTQSSQTTQQSSDPLDGATPIGGPKKVDSPLIGSDNDNLPTMLGKAVAAPFAGFGAGLLSTAAGASDIVHAPQGVRDTLHEYAGDNENTSIGEKFGYGGETLVEFLLGDEALKGLSQSDKLKKISDIMKTLENSPITLYALKTGVEALKAGGIQGVQTLIRSGGDTGQAAKDAGAMARASAVLGPIGEEVGLLINKSGILTKAADTYKALSDVSKQNVADTVSNAVKGIKDKIDSIFDWHNGAAEAQTKQAATDLQKAKEQAATEAAQRQRELEEQLKAHEGSSADKAKLAKQAAQEEAEQRKLIADQQRTRSETQAEELLKARNDAAEKAKTDATQAVHQDLATNLQKNAPDLPEGVKGPEDIAGNLSTLINTAKENNHKAYDTMIEDVTSKLEGQTIPRDNSNTSNAAIEALGKPSPADTPIQAAAKAARNETLEQRTKELLETAAYGGPLENAEKGAIGPAAIVNKTPDATIQDLLNERKDVRATAQAMGEKHGWHDPNYTTLRDLIKGIDDDVTAMAQHTNNPEVIQQVADARKAYFDNSRDLETTTGEKLNINPKNKDKALDDATKYVINSPNALARIELISRLGKTAGIDGITPIVSTKIRQLADLAQDNPKAALTSWNAIKDAVKDRLFGPELRAKIDGIFDAHSQGLAHVEDAYQKALDDAKAERTSSTAINTQARTNTLEDAEARQSAANQGADTEHATTLADTTKQREIAKITNPLIQAQDVAHAQTDYDDAMARINDKLEQARTTQKEDTASITPRFMQGIEDGATNPNFLQGDIPLDAIRKAKSVAGDDWQTIADGIHQKVIQNSSPGGRFDPAKYLDWYEKVKPDVFNEVFSTRDPASLQKVQSIVNDIKDTASVKKLAKAGIYIGTGLGGATLGVGGGALAGSIANTALPGSAAFVAPAISRGFETIVGAIGLTAGLKGVKDFVEYAANHPTTWKIIGGIGKAGEAASKVVNSDTGKAIGKAAKVYAGEPSRKDYRSSIYAGAASALGGK